jgi:hypothetical protein
MKISYFLLKENHTPDINERAYTKSDVLKIFNRDRVYFKEKEIDVDGYYEVDEKGREHVIINKKLQGLEWLRTALHEMVHHFLDYPIDDETVKLCRSMETLRTRQDINAEGLSLVLMFPFWELEKFLLTGEIRPELQPYIAERLRIFNDYSI